MPWKREPGRRSRPLGEAWHHCWGEREEKGWAAIGNSLCPSVHMCPLACRRWSIPGAAPGPPPPPVARSCSPACPRPGLSGLGKPLTGLPWTGPLCSRKATHWPTPDWASPVQPPHDQKPLASPLWTRCLCQWEATC